MKNTISFLITLVGIFVVRSIFILIIWNSVYPSISGLSEIGFGQAFALAVLFTLIRLPINYTTRHGGRVEL